MKNSIKATHYVGLLLLVFSALLNVAKATQTQTKTFTLGVVPQQSPKRMAELWQPLIDYVEAHTGMRISFQTSKDIPTFEANLAKGLYDIAYMNPYHFVAFNDSVGYKALARQKDKVIKGIIVVHKDSPIRLLSELAGTEIAFPAPTAFAATIITSAELRKNAIPFTSRYVNSHDSVYYAVKRKFFKAGGGILRTLNSIPEEVRRDIRVLWISDGFTPHAVATHPDMAQPDRQAILKALLALTDDSSQSIVLKNLGFEGFMPSKDNDWDDVRALGITSLSRPHF